LGTAPKEKKIILLRSNVLSRPWRASMQIKQNHIRIHFLIEIIFFIVLADKREISPNAIHIIGVNFLGEEVNF